MAVAQTGLRTDERLRYAGALAAAGAAALYLLVGIGLLSVGTASSGEAPDLLSFGLTMGLIFAIVAGLLLRFRSRAVWFAVAVLQLIVIVGYFAMSGIRTPPVELWGVLIKLCQLVVLATASMLALRGGETER
jgi:hypothetical protein